MSSKEKGKKAVKPNTVIKAIFDSQKNKSHGAHGIGCRN